MSESASLYPAKPVRKKKRHLVRRIILWLVFLLVLTFGGLYAYSRLKSEYTITYDSYSASRGSISNSLSFSGSLQLVTSSTYSNASSATVRSIYVTEGESVSSGKRLMRLSNGETVKAEFNGTVNTIADLKQVVDRVVEALQTADFFTPNFSAITSSITWRI